MFHAPSSLWNAFHLVRCQVGILWPWNVAWHGGGVPRTFARASDRCVDRFCVKLGSRGLRQRRPSLFIICQKWYIIYLLGFEKCETILFTFRAAVIYRSTSQQRHPRHYWRPLLLFYPTLPYPRAWDNWWVDGWWTSRRREGTRPRRRKETVGPASRLVCCSALEKSSIRGVVSISTIVLHYKQH